MSEELDTVEETTEISQVPEISIEAPVEAPEVPVEMLEAKWPIFLGKTRAIF